MTRNHDDEDGRRSKKKRRRKRCSRPRGRKGKPPPKLTEEERARVCELLQNFEKDPRPILEYGESVLNRDRRRFLLIKQDKKDILAKYAWRVSKYKPRFLEAQNPWAYMKTTVRHCVYDHVRRRKFKVNVTFRPRARIKSLIKNLRLNGAEIKEKTPKGERNEASKCGSLRARLRICAMIHGSSH